jgi:hypothetical protein
MTMGEIADTMRSALRELAQADARLYRGLAEELGDGATAVEEPRALIQPGGWRDEQAQANGAGEEHPPGRPGFTGAGVVAAGVALAFGGEVLAIEAGELIVGRIIGAVAPAGFTGDQKTGLVPAVGGSIEQLFAQLGCLLLWPSASSCARRPGVGPTRSSSRAWISWLRTAALVALKVTIQLSSRCRLSINAEQVARNGESDF